LRACALPRGPFLRLIEANRRDQRVSRCASFAELLDSCALSANPVGELVLGVFGAATPERIALSDRICSALQIAEHCQDVAEDFARGRVYLPADDLAACGCDASMLAAPSAGPELRAALRLQTERARRLLREGEPLLEELRGAARLAVLGFAAGCHAALDAVERVGFDVLGCPARVRRRDVVRRAAGLAWRRRRGSP
jgi:phytoene/squalene synthetase